MYFETQRITFKEEKKRKQSADVVDYTDVYKAIVRIVGEANITTDTPRELITYNRNIHKFDMDTDFHITFAETWGAEVTLHLSFDDWGKGEELTDGRTAHKILPLAAEIGIGGTSRTLSESILLADILVKVNSLVAKLDAIFSRLDIYKLYGEAV